MKMFKNENNKHVVQALERSLPIFGIDKTMPLILVNADISFLGYGGRIEDIVEEIESDAERPVIFYSYFSQDEMEIEGHPVSRLFYRKDVGLVKMPFEFVEIKKLYDFLVSGKKIANPAVEAFLSLRTERNLANILLHDICHDHLVLKTMEKAKKEFGFVGSKEEVKNHLEAIRKGELAKKWKDKIFPGVFCDIEGTLFVDSKVNDKILEMLKKYSENKPVTLWSGGDLGEIKKKLVANRIVYPLVSKYLFKGCDVEIIIDDLSQGEFTEKYGILSREYVQIKK